MSTYLDMADTTYSRGFDVRERRGWGRVEIYDSNTVGKDYLCLKVSDDFGPKDELSHAAHIRLNKGQVKQIIKALQKFINTKEGEMK